jgi:hypothetical protein
MVSAQVFSEAGDGAEMQVETPSVFQGDGNGASGSQNGEGNEDSRANDDSSEASAVKTGGSESIAESEEGGGKEDADVSELDEEAGLSTREVEREMSDFGIDGLFAEASATEAPENADRGDQPSRASISSSVSTRQEACPPPLSSPRKSSFFSTATSMFAAMRLSVTAKSNADDDRRIDSAASGESAKINESNSGRDEVLASEASQRRSSGHQSDAADEDLSNIVCYGEDDGEMQASLELSDDLSIAEAVAGGDQNTGEAGNSALAKLLNFGDCTEGKVDQLGDGAYVSIGIESPAKPKPALVRSPSKAAIVRPNLLPIAEGVASTLKTEGLKLSLCRLGRALRNVISVLPVTKMSPECYEAVERLKTSGQPLEPRFVEELEHLGSILQRDPVPRLSPLCNGALDEMVSAGKMLDMKFIAELQETKALAFCAKPPGEYQKNAAATEQLAELRASVASCTLSTLETTYSPELLALWSLIHTSVSSEISAEIAEEVEHREMHYMAQKKKAASSLRMSGLLLVAAEEDPGAGGDTDLAEELHVKEVAQQKVKEVAKKEEVMALTQRITNSGLKGMEHTMRLSRQRVDEGLQMIREGRAVLAGGCLTTFSLPPLLRLEIVRDFFQIAGLFFSGMYGPVLRFLEEHGVSDLLYQTLTWLRNAYNWFALDISQLIAYLAIDATVAEKAAVALLMIGILIIHWGFIAVVLRLWWMMPRTADKVRHGHEATTWATFAEQNAWTTKFTTVFITICLTVYLPLTQISFNVLVVTDDPRDLQAMNAVHFASQFRDGPFWFFFPLEAILLLFTFTLLLPILLVWSIKKNQPNGSLENEDVTYDLDGERVAFDDKVYTALVSSDPSQLGCPYRSLYAGFERNWSSYKVMLMVAKILLAVIVVSAGRSVQIGGTMISVFYFLVVALSWYSKPFIDPFDDKMELLSKFTALTTAVGATAVAYVNGGAVSPSVAKHIENFMGFVVCVHGLNIIVMVAVLLLGIDGVRVRIKRAVGWITFSDTSLGIMDGRANNVIPNWNLQKEAKHRVWQSFWRALLLGLAMEEENASRQEDRKRSMKKKRLNRATGAARLSALEEAVVASGLQRVKSHWHGREHTYTAHLRRLARDALEGVDVYWNNPSGARDGHLDSVTFFGKMYVVPYPFQCVVVYDDAQDEAIITDECDEKTPLASHTNLAKLLSLNFTPEIMAKRELRQKLRILSAHKTEIELEYKRFEKGFLWMKFRGWKSMKFRGWTLKFRGRTLKLPIFSMPGYYKFECTYYCGIIRVQTSSDKSGILLRVNKSGAVKVVRRWIEKQIKRTGLAGLNRWVVNKIVAVRRWVARQFARKELAGLKRWVRNFADSKPVKRLKQTWSTLVRCFAIFKPLGHSKREMADGFNVTMKYKDGRGEIVIPNTENKDQKYTVYGRRKVVLKADHIGLRASMEESDKLRGIFESTRDVWEKGLKELRKKHQEYRQNLADTQKKQTDALSDDFWFFVYNDPHLRRDKLEQYLLEYEENKALKSLVKDRNEALDSLYLRQQWVFLSHRITFWYVFWDDVYARNSDFTCLKPEDFDPVSAGSICYHYMERSELEQWLRDRKLFKWWRLFNKDLLELLYNEMDKHANNPNVNAKAPVTAWKA